MDFPIILMRHGESDHNVVKKALKKKLKLKKIKKTPEYQDIKYLPSLRQDRLTENGKLQAVEASKNIDWSNVSLVLVSPLLRCLETCQVMLRNVDISIEVVVEPLIASRMTNAWSLGEEKSKLTSEFPNFNFDHLVEKRVPWFASFADQQDRGSFKQNKNPLEVLQKSGIQESYHDFRKRGEELSRQIDRRMQISPQKRILIISHSCTLKLFTAVGFMQTGKTISDISFENGDVIYIKRSACFKYVSPSPKF